MPPGTYLYLALGQTRPRQPPRQPGRLTCLKTCSFATSREVRRPPLPLSHRQSRAAHASPRQPGARALRRVFIELSPFPSPSPVSCTTLALLFGIRSTCLCVVAMSANSLLLTVLLVALSAVGAQAKRESTNRFQPEEIAGLCIGFAVLSLTLGILIAVSCKMAARIRVLESHLNLLEV